MNTYIVHSHRSRQRIINLNNINKLHRTHMGTPVQWNNPHHVRILSDHFIVLVELKLLLFIICARRSTPHVDEIIVIYMYWCPN